MLYRLCSNSLEDDSIGNTGDQEAAKSLGSTIDGEQQSNIKKVVHLSPDDSTFKESHIQNFLWDHCKDMESHGEKLRYSSVYLL